jgi:hypothetical protein
MRLMTAPLGPSGGRVRPFSSSVTPPALPTVRTNGRFETHSRVWPAGNVSSVLRPSSVRTRIHVASDARATSRYGEATPPVAAWTSGSHGCGVGRAGSVLAGPAAGVGADVPTGGAGGAAGVAGAAGWIGGVVRAAVSAGDVGRGGDSRVAVADAGLAGGAGLAVGRAGLVLGALAVGELVVGAVAVGDPAVADGSDEGGTDVTAETDASPGVRRSARSSSGGCVTRATANNATPRTTSSAKLTRTALRLRASLSTTAGGRGSVGAVTRTGGAAGAAPS